MAPAPDEKGAGVIRPERDRENSVNGGDSDMTIPGISFSSRIEAGHVMQLLGLIVLGCGAYYGLSARTDAANNKVEDVNHKVDRLEASMTAQIAEVRGAMDKGFLVIGAKIDGIPIISEKLLQLGVQMREAVTRLDQQATKLADTDRMAYEARETAKRLESRVDRLDADTRAPVPVRTTR